MLVAAETYAFVILCLGYLQTIWPLRRTPVPLPDDPEDWPAVDLLIPTYNEPLSVVRYTALAAMNIDWPADKLNVYILDDGKREEFRAFAEEAGIGYMTRDDNKHAKAGNINQRAQASRRAVCRGLRLRSRPDAQLPAGHAGLVPARRASWPCCRRRTTSTRPIRSSGISTSSASFPTRASSSTASCRTATTSGTPPSSAAPAPCCAAPRSTRSAAIAVETVTEDAHTSLRMQMNGWNTAYINIPQAAGLATERLSGHVKQRIRWARGMIQIMRIDNPLFARGLKPAQRLCYFNAMSHFLYALPRLIFLSAPLIYLILGRTNVPGYWAAILAYAVPAPDPLQHHQLAHSGPAPPLLLERDLRDGAGALHSSAHHAGADQSQARQLRRHGQGRRRQPALLRRPHRAALPGDDRLQSARASSWRSRATGRFPFLGFLYDGTHPGTIVMNLLWTFFNVTILGVATAVAWESQQRRQTVRVAMAVPADVHARRRHPDPGNHRRHVLGRRHDQAGRRREASHGRGHRSHLPRAGWRIRHPGDRRRLSRRRRARPVRSAHPAGGRGAHHGSLLPRRHLAGLGRIPRGRPPLAQPAAHLRSLPSRTQANDGQSQHAQEGPGEADVPSGHTADAPVRPVLHAVRAGPGSSVGASPRAGSWRGSAGADCGYSQCQSAGWRQYAWPLR